jgi:hydroxymethylpyrimidine pyrophosphatase-like HAD family hydrolase
MSTYALTRPLLLALDLDASFVETFPDERRQLVEMLGAAQHPLRIVYMSHESAEALIHLAADAGLTVPHMLMADSGTTALKGDGTGTIEPLQRNIIQLWPGKDAVIRAMKPITTLRPLDDNAPCRQGFQYDTPPTLGEARKKADEIGCQVQERGLGRLDVLPFGVDKGSTLGRYIVQENIAPTQVLAFGEAHGDVNLFGRGWRGVVFPHAPSELVSESRRFHNVFMVQMDGAKGVLEGLRHFGWLELSA